MENFWQGKSVLLTGHTGFKGSWLAFLLAEMGAKVHGYALAPDLPQNLFDLANIREYLASHTIGDIRDFSSLKKTYDACQPDLVLHLAAQPLVIESYKNPVDTYSTNVLGTAHVLEACRYSESLRAAVVITTDKVYHNKEWIWGYREDDRLGGKDPYSASKACAEMVVDSYRTSFFQDSQCLIASARAGNIFGGGDWSAYRLVPDIIQAVASKKVLSIRSPQATRPWQHVLEPLVGYLALAKSLLQGHRDQGSAWNFGPSDSSCQTVRFICEEAQKFYGPRLKVDYASEEPTLAEAKFLKLDSSKAKAVLGWSTKLTTVDGLRLTFDWHDQVSNGRRASDLMQTQILKYLSM